MVFLVLGFNIAAHMRSWYACSYRTDTRGVHRGAAGAASTAPRIADLGPGGPPAATPWVTERPAFSKYAGSHVYTGPRRAPRAVLAPASRVSFVSVPVFMLARRSIHSSHGESAGPCGMTSTLLMSNPHSSTRASRRSMRAGSAFCSRVRMYIQEPGPPLHVKYE